MAEVIRRLEYVDLDKVTLSPDNPKGHQLGIIRASIGRFGFVTPAVVDERTGALVAGNGRTEALREMRDAGEDPPDGVRLGEDGAWLVPVHMGWSSRSDAEARAYVIADNQLTIAGWWDEAALGSQLADLIAGDPDLTDVLGFDSDALAAMIAAAAAAGEDDAEDEDKGSLLPVSSVTVGEPDIACSRGEVWWLGEDRVLVVADPHTEWSLWVGLLVAPAVLLPYPSPLTGMATVPDGVRMVMVQPNTYLAGWLLTKWARATGDEPRRVM